MGYFRGVGQLGRAFGPGVAAGVYWGWGGALAYGVGAVGVAGVAGCVWMGVEGWRKGGKEKTK
jgi:hypothetical protein